MSRHWNKPYQSSWTIKTNLYVIAFICVLMGCLSSSPRSHELTPSCGLADIDEIRHELKLTPTSSTNYQSRRAALIRWWRLVWRQGYDMSTFDSLANELIIHRAPSENAYRTLDAAYSCIENISASANKIPTLKANSIQSGNNNPTNWPVYHGTDGSQNGYSRDYGPQTGEIAWRFPKTNGWDAAAVIKEGKVYTAGADTDVVAYCLDENSGAIIWKGRTFSDGYYTQAGAKSTPIVGPDNVLIKTRGRLLNFDLESGKLNGQSNFKNIVDHKLSNQISVVKNNLHLIWGFATDDGFPIWKYQSKASLMCDPVSDANFVYAINQSNEIVKLSKKDGKLIWKKQLPHVLRGQIALKGASLFVSTNDAIILAINPTDGTTLWESQALKKEPRAYEQFSKPVFHQDIMVIGSASNKLYGINQSTGKLEWQTTTRDWVRAAPLILNDQLFVADLSGNIYAYTISNQGLNKIWEQKISDHGFTADLAGSDKGLLASDRNMMLYSIDLATGQVRWRHSQLDGAWIDGQFFAAGEISGQQSSPTVVDSILYIASPDGFVNAIDVENGSELWRFETKSSCSPSPTVAEGKVFVGQTYESFGEYFALDSKTGQPIWQSTEPGKVWISAAYDNGKLFLGNMDGDFFALDPTSGARIWSYFTAKNTPNEHKPITPGHGHGWPPGVYCNPITSDGIVYSGSWSGYYFAWVQETGELVWRCKTQPDGADGGLPDSSAPVLHKNHLYVQKGGSHIAAINKATGKIDWEWKSPSGFLQNGTVAAHEDMIYGSVVRQVIALPYSAIVYAFSDVENGSKLKWKYRGGGGLTAPVLAGEQLIFGSSADPFLTGLDAESGSVLWRTHVGGMMLESVPAIYGDQAFALIKNGYLYAIK